MKKSTLLEATVVLVYLLIVIVRDCDSFGLLYDTEDTLLTDYYDCFYHDSEEASAVKYCRRSVTRDGFVRDEKQQIGCSNKGDKVSFEELRQKNITPNDILLRSVSIEDADKYAAYLVAINISDANNDSLCLCTTPRTFGKYCEYRYEVGSLFSHNLIVQFNYKFDYQGGYTYGSIYCYETVECDSGLMCLDWRDICDGKQQCMLGGDEDNCDLLEFNECEPDEYRCRNGMCIPEEYFVDGTPDCMDFSDELSSIVTNFCFAEANISLCDEHLCSADEKSCGDGQCVKANRFPTTNPLLYSMWTCSNLRDYYYMCEAHPTRQLWTKPNGMCYILEDQYDGKLIDENNATEYCQYLIKCVLSRGFERHCPDFDNCSKLIQKKCSSDRIVYPMGALVRPYVTMVYYRDRDWSKIIHDKYPDEYHITGSIKCRGYQVNISSVDQPFVLYSFDTEFDWMSWETLFCRVGVHHVSPFATQYDRDCWLPTGRTFTGHLYHFHDVCDSTRCVSGYRILDGKTDCFLSTDETYDTLNAVHGKDLCKNQKRFRLRCSDNEPVCLQVSEVGDQDTYCANDKDESIMINEKIQNNLLITSIGCEQRTDLGCQIIRKHISNSWVVHFDKYETINATTLFGANSQDLHIPFWSYCNTFWDTITQMDENEKSCRQWTCNSNEYQCLSGQCIRREWICDGIWDCPDASDEQVIFIFTDQLSTHNQRVIGDLSKVKSKCYDQYKNQAFSTICNITQEYPCLRADVSDPLNIVKNRPCIDLRQIGNGVTDCFGNLDERNLIAGCFHGQKGFDIYCETSRECIPQPLICNHRCENTKDDGVLCSLVGNASFCAGQSNAVCLNRSCIREARCNGKIECPNGEDEYWCYNSSSNLFHSEPYRRHHYKTYDQIKDIRSLPEFPVKTLPSSRFLSESLPSKTLSPNNRQNLTEIFGPYAHICNRGVWMIDQWNNQHVCFCPPTFYGPRCQYMSDRVSVLTHLDLNNYVIPSGSTHAIKLLVKFMFNNNLILDFREVHVFPVFEQKNLYTKHNFHLLYPRSHGFLEHKRTRRRQRSAIIYEHPYSICFEAYELNTNLSIRLIGVWHYPIYFDFLPSFRLAKVLRFPIDSYDPCSSNPCHSNTSQCQRVFNSNTSYVCSCHSGFYGDKCEKYHKNCSLFCSPHAICKIVHRAFASEIQHLLCVCPLGYFGPRCQLKFNQCDSNVCLNNGTCYLPLDPIGIKSFRCICTSQFYGEHCENEKLSVDIELHSNLEEPIHASVMQYFDFHEVTLELILKHQVVSEFVPSSFHFSHGQKLAPVFGLLKLYQSDYQPHFHLLYIQRNTSSVNITSIVNQNTTFCPEAAILLANQSVQLKIPFVFMFHKICQQQKLSRTRKMFCFHDNDYICICENNFNRAECFGYDRSLDSCSHCLANGRCIKGDILDPNDFICLCPRCYHGHRCQFSTELLSFTLDLLIVQNLFSIQIFYLVLVIVLFCIGLFNNFCSVLTFARRNPRKFGAGNYLLVLSILNQLSLFALFLKILLIILGNRFHLSDVISCKIISYFLSVLTRSNYWLSSSISIERMLLVLFPTMTILKQPRVALCLSALILVTILGLHIHEPVYYTVVQSLCVANYATHLAVAQYNRISVLIHYLMPFVIQIISITVLIWFAARSRAKSATRSFSQTLKAQFKSQKELYVTPIIIILSLLPQAIFSFSFACTKLDQAWQRHTLLVTYIFSYTPQILGFLLFVIPSSTYMKEFSETWIGKTQLIKRIWKPKMPRSQ